MGIVECIIYGLVAGAASMLMGMTMINVLLLIIITTGVLKAMELPLKKIIRTTVIVLMIFGMVKIFGPNQISFNFKNVNHDIKIVHRDKFDTASESNNPISPIIEELAHVVTKSGFDSFLYNGRKLTRNGKKFWRFTSGKEVEISKIGDNVLLFETISKEQRGLFHKQLYVIAKGHNIQATWPPGHPELGKLIVTSPVKWIKRFIN